MRNKILLGLERFILLLFPSPNSSSFYPQHHPPGRIENLNKNTEKENYFFDTSVAVCFLVLSFALFYFLFEIPISGHEVPLFHIAHGVPVESPKKIIISFLSQKFSPRKEHVTFIKFKPPFIYSFTHFKT